MHLAKASLLIALLVIPNSTWRDWQQSKNPALQFIIQHAAIGQMMPRTAEHDKITPDAEIRTLLSGARMNGSDDTASLDYPVSQTNLQDALMDAHLQIDIQTDPVKAVAPEIYDPAGKHFVMREMSQPLDSKECSDAMDSLLKNVETSGPGSELIIVSGSPSQEEYAYHQRLCPIAIWQPDAPPGLLTSPSTRTPGLVTNTDIAPTITHMAGIDSLPGPIYGTVIQTQPDGLSDRFDRLTDLADTAQKQEDAQKYVPIHAVTFALIFVLFAGIFLKYRRSTAGERLIVFSIIIPIIMLLADNEDWAFWGLLITLALSPFASSVLSTRNIALVSVVFLLLVTLDAIFNHSEITARSLMGYSYQEGARYYGLGNEAMGALIGSTLALVSGFWTPQKPKRVFGTIAWCVLGLLFALPTVGAKAGGVLVVGVVLVGYLIITRPNTQAKLSPAAQIGMVIGGLLLAVGALFITSRVGGESHVGQTISQSQHFGTSTITSLIYRKLAMDFNLMFHSTWMLVLIVSVGIQYLAMRKWIPPESMEHAQIIWKLGLVCTGACLVLNDAGVVAAALCSLSPLSLLAVLSAYLPDASRLLNPSPDTTPVQQST